MKYFLTIIFSLIAINLSIAQKIESLWFFNQGTYFKIDNDKAFACSPFDFIVGYKMSGDTLQFKHAGWSAPDSKFLIAKLTLDSLFLIPINNSAKAISAKLKKPHYSSVEQIEKNPEAKDISFFTLVKLYSAASLRENVRWVTINLSQVTAGWGGTYYFDIIIQRNGHFLAFKRYIPYAEGKPGPPAETKYYEDQLSAHQLDQLNLDLNKSGIKWVNKIKFPGGSSHGRFINFKVAISPGAKSLTADENEIPYMLKDAINSISNIAQDDALKQTSKRFIIETTFLLPEALRGLLKDEEVADVYAPGREISPVYLRGDFNGDNKIDYATLVWERKSFKMGILIYHPDLNTYIVAGAGNTIPNQSGNNYRWMDSWEIFSGKTVNRGIGEPNSIKLKGDGILLTKADASSGLIYWDGKEYRWYQQGD